METTYRLEFNQNQQHFHLDRGNAEPNTHGWITITDHCTDYEFRIYESFVNRVKKKKITNEYALRCLTEIKGFISNLMEYGLTIK